MKENYKRSPIPYMGNKYKLLKDILPLFPKECDIFIDAFGGSGVVSMNYSGNKQTIYNELNPNIVELVKIMVNNKPEELDKYWKDKVEYYNLPRQSIKANDRITRKGYDDRKENYNKMREDYNNSKERDYRDLFLLSCYSINHLIRFNGESQFNASSGADAYNDVNFQRVKDMYETFKNVEIKCGSVFDLDFENLTENSFVYNDPPYLNTEAVYNEKSAFGGWDIDCDYKLFEILEKLDKKGVKWGLSNVFENRGNINKHLIEWCQKNNWKVYHLDRNYNPFSRGNSNNDEVYICNYGYETENKEIKYEQVDLFNLL